MNYFITCVQATLIYKAGDIFGWVVVFKTLPNSGSNYYILVIFNLFWHTMETISIY